MKTTLNIDDALLADAKVWAVRQQSSLTRLIEEGLRLRMRAHVPSGDAPPLALPVFNGHSGLLPGIDPKSNKSLLAALGDDA